MNHPILKNLPKRSRWLAPLALAAALAPLAAAQAQGEPFIGQMMWTAANFCPKGWAEANGQLLPIAQNPALFSLLGTNFGGNGTVTFALPDLRGRSQVHVGTGPGLGPVVVGQPGGVESATLQVSQLPAHRHALNASTGDAGSASPANGVLARPKATATTTATATGTAQISGNGKKPPETVPVDIALDVDVAVATYGNPGTSNATLAAESVGLTGGGQPLETRSPYLGMMACISLFGIFPSRD